MIVYPKEIIISTLRDAFSKDSYYRYVKDSFGFANTTDHTDLPLDAGLHNDLTTRLFIGENYRKNAIFYPAILVKSGGSKSVPISMNRNSGSIEYEPIIYQDGYGLETIISKPKYMVTAGVWEGSIIIDVLSRSLRARDDLVEFIGMFFTEISFDNIKDIGIVIKPPSIGSPSETEDRNDKLFRQSITLEIRTEWCRKIPVSNIIEAILFTMTFQNISEGTPPAANLTINTEVSLTDLLINI
jgi:hypothetical protein